MTEIIIRTTPGQVFEEAGKLEVNHSDYLENATRTKSPLNITLLGLEPLGQGVSRACRDPLNIFSPGRSLRLRNSPSYQKPLMFTELVITEAGIHCVLMAPALSKLRVWMRGGQESGTASSATSLASTGSSHMAASTSSGSSLILSPV